MGGAGSSLRLLGIVLGVTALAILVVWLVNVDSEEGVTLSGAVPALALAALSALAGILLYRQGNAAAGRAREQELDWAILRIAEGNHGEVTASELSAMTRTDTLVAHEALRRFRAKTEGIVVDVKESGEVVYRILGLVEPDRPRF